MRNNGKVSNYGRIVKANCPQRRKSFMLYLTARSFGRQLQLMVKLLAEELYLFYYILNHHH